MCFRGKGECDSPIATALPLQIVSQELIIRRGDLAIALMYTDKL